MWALYTRYRACEAVFGSELTRLRCTAGTSSDFLLVLVLALYYSLPVHLRKGQQAEQMAKSIEQRVGDLEQIIEDLPGILNVRFAQAESERDEIKARLAGVDARVAGVDAKIETLNARMSNFELSIEQVKVELGALPCVIGQILTERLQQPS
jgi:chromosome segregation ATPase